ncbi:hypothetical protein P7C73_g5865, partial [Tremellales sp. Uapishka_1]
MSSPVKETIVLITGANTGVGYETAVALLRSTHAYLLLVGARSEEKAQAAVDKMKADVGTTRSSLATVVVDVCSDASIAKLAEEIGNKYGRLDVLINNAGQSLDLNPGLSTREAFQKTFDVNVAGAHILTQALAPHLIESPSPRLIFVSSSMGTFAEATKKSHINPELPAGWPKPWSFELPSYRASKTALNMIMRDWYRILKNDGVKVWAVSPGFLATDLGGVKEMLSTLYRHEDIGLTIAPWTDPAFLGSSLSPPIQLPTEPPLLLPTEPSPRPPPTASSSKPGFLAQLGLDGIMTDAEWERQKQETQAQYDNAVRAEAALTVMELRAKEAEARKKSQSKGRWRRWFGKKK